MLWFDHIVLQEADVTITDPDDHLRFEYNATRTPVTASLDGAYRDVRGAAYSGAVTLEPFTSLVRIKQ